MVPTDWWELEESPFGYISNPDFSQGCAGVVDTTSSGPTDVNASQRAALCSCSRDPGRIAGAVTYRCAWMLAKFRIHGRRPGRLRAIAVIAA